MIVDERIRRFQHREGFRLADVADIGLPAYTLNIEAVTMAHKRLSPIDEFVLKSISLGLSSASELSEYLGLQAEILEPALARLAQTENVALAATTGRQSWSLTIKGQATLRAAEIVAPENRTFTIHFDAVLRKPTFFRFQKLYRHRDLEHEGMIELEVYPPRRPEQREFTAADLERIVRPLAGGGSQRRDILAIRSIDASSIKKIYLRAVALLFKSLDDDRLQLGFVIDGKLSQEHEVAFSASQGYNRFISRVYVGRDLDADEGVQKLIEGVRLESDDGVPVSVSVAKSQADIAEAEEKLSRANSTEIAQLREQLEAAQKRLEALTEANKRRQVRDLYMLDHPPLLVDALDTAKERLLIISPWIYGVVVDNVFLGKLEALLRRGVNVLIGYGINEDETKLKRQPDVDARKKLAELARRNPNFVLKRLGNTHAKVLLKDREYVVVTSFNWLSFRGNPHPRLRDEQGVLISDPEQVEKKFCELKVRFVEE
jgi:hypothetical protein